MRKTRYGMLTAALLTSVLAFGETFTDGNGLVWTYTAKDGEATLSGVERQDGNALEGALQIPGTIGSATVTEIEAKSFQELQITSLTFAEGVKTINRGAFANCTSLTSVTFPDSLETVSGDTTTTRIGAFSGCSSLVSVDFGNGFVTIGDATSNTSSSSPDAYASSGVFGNCINLETVVFSANLKKIGHHAFSECSALQSVTVPDSVKSIGNNAFYRNTNLSSVSLGTGLETIGAFAFCNCPELQTVVFRPCDTPRLAIGNRAFADAPKLSTLTFSEAVRSIGTGAFANCTSLTTVTFPDSLESVSGDTTTTRIGAFSGCSSLVSVDFGNGFVTIGDATSNTSSSSPDAYASSGVFGNCTHLETVVFSANLKKIGHHAFSECSALQSVTVPDSVKSIGNSAFYRNTNLSSVSLGTGLETIGTFAFSNCPELQTVVFRPCDTPRLAIGNRAFADAPKLSTLTFSEAVRSIGTGAFANCTSLTSVTFPDSLETVSGDTTTTRIGAFSGCSSLVRVNLGNGLVTIGDATSNTSSSSPDAYASSGVFGNCVNLETIVFGPNLITIGHHAFSECKALRSLDFPDSVQTIGVNCFYDNMRLTRVAFGADLLSIGRYAFAKCESLNSVSFSTSTLPTLEIDSYAFQNCIVLSSLMFNNAVPTIKSGAFSGCTLLRKIVIPSVISNIDDGVFSGLASLNEVTFLGLPPENLASIGLGTNVKIRYPKEYASDWDAAVVSCGFTDAAAFESSDIGSILLDGSRYDLSSSQADRSIASIAVDGDTSIASFVLTDGKVYDSVLRIVNTANQDVTLSLPAGFEYETFEGANPLTIPANSRNLLTITRTAANTFLVSREKLKVLE